MQLPTFPNSNRHIYQRFLDAALAPQSRIGYSYDWALYERWCSQHQCLAVPPSAEVVSSFVSTQLESCKVATVRRRYHAISRKFKDAGYTHWGQTVVVTTLAGAQRLRLEKPRRKRPVTIAQLREISAALERLGTPAAIRNRALVLAGFASALRSVSLAELMVDDVEFTGDGLILTIPREKQDQEGRGRLIGIPHGKHNETCPVRALRHWLDIRPKAETRHVFVSFYLDQHRPIAGETICKIVQRCARKIGLNPRFYGAHSLRSGFITAAGEAGLSDLLIAEHTGHRNMNVLRTYLRRTNVFRANACAALDL